MLLHFTLTMSGPAFFSPAFFVLAFSALPMVQNRLPLQWKSFAVCRMAPIPVSLSYFEGALLLETFRSHTALEIYHIHILTTMWRMCLHMNRKAQVACNLNRLIEIEGLFKIKGNHHIHCKYSNISQMVNMETLLWPLIGSDIWHVQLQQFLWPWVISNVIHPLQAFSNGIFVSFCSSCRYVHWHWASRGPSAVTEFLVTKFSTTQLPQLHNLISVQRPRSTRASSVVTLAWPPSPSSLKITDRSFRYASRLHLVSEVNSLYLFVNLILVPVPSFPTHRVTYSFTRHFFLFWITTLLVHYSLSLSLSFTPDLKPTCFTNPTPLP